MKKLVFRRFLIEGCRFRHNGESLCAFPTWACSAKCTPETFAVHSSKLRAFFPTWNVFCFLFSSFFFYGQHLASFCEAVFYPCFISSSPTLYLCHQSAIGKFVKCHQHPKCNYSRLEFSFFLWIKYVALTFSVTENDSFLKKCNSKTEAALTVSTWFGALASMS